eukprot:TRINITY_DN12470_c0_g1_i1.p1 TRINITY_DN12470_c0_g1~~TRINITY_DN12470_c0_g1_i1.p1  ORF type:complete len:206 (-),score=25.82 TRINITY_DN12470_c0_g1_i1:75-692(-)
MARHHSSGLFVGFGLVVSLLAAWINQQRPSFVNSKLFPHQAGRFPLIVRRAAPALAPSPVRSRAQPGLPQPIDDTRYGEKVRWLVDSEASRPPEWRVILLESTFRKPSNTIPSVAACLVAVLGIGLGLAMLKAQHASQHFFSTVVADTEWNEALRKAQALRNRGLCVRLVPGTSRSNPQGGSELPEGNMSGEPAGTSSQTASGRR